MLAYSSLLYKQCVAAIDQECENRVCRCEQNRLSFVWFFDICRLQFGIVREVCCCLVQFGDLLSLGTLQLLDLLCGSLFCLCLIRIWYLYLWTFGSLVLYLWGRVIWVYLGFGFVRVLLPQFVLSQICYSEICSSSPMDVGLGMAMGRVWIGYTHTLPEMFTHGYPDTNTHYYPYPILTRIYYPWISIPYSKPI